MTPVMEEAAPNKALLNEAMEIARKIYSERNPEKLSELFKDIDLKSKYIILNMLYIHQDMVDTQLANASVLMERAMATIRLEEIPGPDLIEKAILGDDETLDEEFFNFTDGLAGEDLFIPPTITFNTGIPVSQGSHGL